MLPVETYKITAGIKGGIAGGVAMSIPAMLYGLIKYHSIWYAINLLAAGGFVSWAGESNAFLAEFHLRGFLAALAIHGVTSLSGRTSLWRDAPYVPQMADPYVRFYCPVFVDGTGLQYPRHR
jgi:hypothetical protein